MVTKLIPDQDFAAALAPQVNLLVNPGYEVWQRGVTFTNPADQTTTADRWKTNKSGTLPTYTVTQDASVVDNGLYSLKANFTVVASDSILNMITDIENVISYRGKTITLSIRMKSNLGGNKVGIRIYKGDGYTADAYHTGGGNWETLSITCVVSAAATILRIYAGSINDGNTSAFYYNLDSAMLVVGSQPVSYIPMHPADDLARCMRYYEARTGIHWQFFNGASMTVHLPLTFMTAKSATPTVTVTNGTPSNMSTGATSDGITAKGFNVTFITTGGTPVSWGNAQDASWTAEVA